MPPVVGAATSSLHSEGAARASDWGGWEAEGWVPASGDGNGFATRYADDAALLAAHGLGSLRLTLEWARLEPQPSDRGLDTAEVERYRRVLRGVRDAGLEAWACLAHTSLPGWFSEDERGFLDDRMARRVWPRHVDRVAEAFGDLVDGWITVHEPVRHALDAFLHGTLPPGRHDPDDAHRALRLLTAADAEAARLLVGPVPVTTCRWLPAIRPAGATPEARRAATAAEDLLWRSWREHDDPAAWLGVSASVGITVGADGSFAPWPGALPDALDRIGELHPGRPVVLLTTDPAAHRGAVDDAVADGLDLRQVHWWSAVDGYEGWAGFDVRTGLFDRDREPTLVEALT